MAKFCTRCGSPIEEGQVCRCSAGNTYGSPVTVNVDTSSIKSFLISLKNRMGIGEPENDGSGIYERGMLITPDSIKPNEGEIPIKQYNIAVLRTRIKLMRAEGRMQITNKRLLFRATGRSIMGRTTLQHEFAIDDIAGLEARKDYSFSFFDLFFGNWLLSLFFVISMGLTVWLGQNSQTVAVIIGLLLGVAGAIPFFTVHKKFWLKLMPVGASLGGMTAAYAASNGNRFMLFLLIISLLIAIVALLLVSFVPNLIINIKTKSGQSGTGSIEIRRKKKMGLLSFIFPNSSSAKEEYTGYEDVLPTNETEGAIREIGAIINDIQKLGDFGIEKWKK